MADIIYKELSYALPSTGSGQASAPPWKSTASSAQASLRQAQGRHGSSVPKSPGPRADPARHPLRAIQEAAGLLQRHPSGRIRSGSFGKLRTCFVIEGKIIPSTSSGQRLEIKAVSTLHPRHEAQAINYLTATGFRLAILLNPSTSSGQRFGASSLEHQRMVK